MWRLVIPSCAISLVVSPMSNLVKSAFVINSHGLYCHFWWLNPAPENPKIWRLNHSCWELNHLKSWVLLVQSAISWHFMTTCYCSLVWSPFCFGLKFGPFGLRKHHGFIAAFFWDPRRSRSSPAQKGRRVKAWNVSPVGGLTNADHQHIYSRYTHTHIYIYIHTLHYITLLNIYMSYTVST